MVLLWSFLFSLVFIGGECKCLASESCPKVEPKSLNIHVVSHSHDDVGWLKTVEQYFYGANNSIQNAGVQYIYDSVLDELWKDPEKKFVSVEMEFFSHWWKEQDKKMRDKVHKIVNRGQLEFVGGGWCMNDEATSSYVDIIDQMTLGLKFLNETFGRCSLPKAVWQVDPFGHSREQASIFAQMGFEFLFLGRIDHQDKRDRLEKKEMEMMWKVSDSLDIKLFTGVLYNTYGPPPGFCFDILCGDETIVDDPDSPMFNIDRRAKQLVNYVLEQSKHFATQNVILTMGEDFHYQYAHAWYKNLDKLIKYINKAYMTSGIRMFYSTPSCYGKAVQDSLRSELPWKRDDFFPYSSDPHAYWTGYFSSRPTFKGLVRQSSNLLQSCKHLEAASSAAPGKPSGDLFQFQRNQAIAQHHDAITGTAKQHVSNDYVLRLDQSMRQGFRVLSDSYNRLLPYKLGSEFLLEQEYCLLLNVSQCRVTETEPSFVVTLYNPLSFRVSHTVRFPVGNASYVVSDGDTRLESQLIPIPDAILDLPGRESDSRFELAFLATDLPPLGIKSYHVTSVPQASVEPSTRRVIPIPSSADVVVSTRDLTLRFDRLTGLLAEVSHLSAGFSVEQQLLLYSSMAGNNSQFEFRASGAYIFRPNGTALPLGSVEQLVVVDGPVVTQVHQQFNSWSSQVIRLNPTQPYVEVDWIVGPIPVDDGVGKEVVVRFTARQIQSNSTFYTDSNGREIVERKLNFQPTYDVNVTEPVASNYYPVNSVAFVEDSSSAMRMLVLNDRAQGVTSLHQGSLEFMIHRRLVHDDAFGVGEALNETAFSSGLVVRGSHWLLMTDTGIWRPLALRKAHPPILSFVPTLLSPVEWKQLFRTELSLLSRSLPENINLLTVEPWDTDRILIRLEHIYGLGEDAINSRPATVSVKVNDLSLHFAQSLIYPLELLEPIL